MRNCQILYKPIKFHRETIKYSSKTNKSGQESIYKDDQNLYTTEFLCKTIKFQRETIYKHDQNLYTTEFKPKPI